MANWYEHLLKTAAYSNETGYLNSYMKQGFDPYDFQHLLPQFLKKNNGLTPQWKKYIADGEDYQIMDEWAPTATPQQLEDFKGFCLNHPQTGQDGTEEPPYLSMDYRGMQKAQWLVHFTEDADAIATQGFKFGFGEENGFRGLALTTHFTDKHRKKEPGYNFAFEADRSRSINQAADTEKYGKEAVVFWSSAVSLYHYGDEEHQMVFWGPQVNKSMIFPIGRDENDGKWYVPNHANDRPFKSETFSDCVDWITSHYQLLLQGKNAADKQLRYRRQQEALRKQRQQNELV